MGLTCFIFRFLRRPLLQWETAPLQHRGHVFAAIHIFKARCPVQDFKGPGLEFHSVRLAVRAEVPLVGCNRLFQIDRPAAILKRHGVLREAGTDERLNALRRLPDEEPSHHKALFGKMKQVAERGFLIPQRSDINRPETERLG